MVQKKTKSKTIYYNQQVIYIGEPKNASGEFKPVDVKNAKELKKFLKGYFRKGFYDDILINGYEPKRIFKDLKRCFKYVKAAGGLVNDEQSRYLFIKRHDIWDLPKGKFDKGERPRECAVREVEEETGLKKPKIVKKLNPTYHIYPQKGSYALKKTWWYHMITNGDQKLKPEIKENITEVVWFDFQKSQEAINQSYRSLKDTLSPFISG